MSKFIIEGGDSLKGEVEIKGMKNAALPILASCLLTDQDCILEGVPNILDVQRLITILESLNVKVKKENNFLIINAKDLNLKKLDKDEVCKIRSSVLLLGPLLTRFSKVILPEPGGCLIGNRPLDTHLYALKKMGAEISQFDNCYKISIRKAHYERAHPNKIKAVRLKGSTIILPEFSVTATENILMAAVLAEGQTIIKLAAAEPHVQNLINFLIKMGAKIEGIGSHTLKIKGVKKLKGVRIKIIPDQIEVGTFAALAAATHSHIKIKNIIPEHLEIILVKLEEIGVKFHLGDDFLEIYPSSNLRAFRLQALPYPGFPTDLQSIFGVLATQCHGTSLIQDPLFESRMGYVQELIKMGANAILADPHRVIITGPTPLFGQEIKSLDLRAGATLIIAALVAQGQSIIDQAEIVDRGYEKIDERLMAIGARIKRVE